MFDVGSIGNFASIIGLVLAIAVAIYQREVALKAEREAKVEREKAATLEDHLIRQRWQQLRSLGEQIDQIERDSSQISDPASAALHARLKEQYASILGVIAVSNSCYSVSLIRRWVSTGRLFRTWQISEALTYVNVDNVDKSNADDEKWLKELIERSNASSKQHPQSIQLPIELNEFAAAYILISDLHFEMIKSKLGSGQNNYSLVTVLGFLAYDYIEKHTEKFRDNRYKCWGWDDSKSFEERYQYYQKMDFWMVVATSDKFQLLLSDYNAYFENTGSSTNSILPINKAIHEAKELFPELYISINSLHAKEKDEKSPKLYLEKI